MNDQDIINALWFAVIALTTVDVVLVFIALHLSEQLRRTQRLLNHPEFHRDSNGRRFKERI